MNCWNIKNQSYSFIRVQNIPTFLRTSWMKVCKLVLLWHHLYYIFIIFKNDLIEIQGLKIEVHWMFLKESNILKNLIYIFKFKHYRIIFVLVVHNILKYDEYLIDQFFNIFLRNLSQNLLLLKIFFRLRRAVSHHRIELRGSRIYHFKGNQILYFVVKKRPVETYPILI